MREEGVFGSSYRSVGRGGDVHGLNYPPHGDQMACGLRYWWNVTGGDGCWSPFGGCLRAHRRLDRRCSCARSICGLRDPSMLGRPAIEAGFG